MFVQKTRSSKDDKQIVAKRKKYSKELLRENAELISIMLPTLILIFIFCYIPMYGVVIAFQDYAPGRPFLSFDGSTRWVGLEHFITFINSRNFSRLMRNTLLLSFYNLIFGFWIPIAFAILLNEIRSVRLRKFFQTASYLPYFISMVVVAGLTLSFIETNGLINRIIVALGGTAKSWRTSKSAFPFIYTFVCIWKSFGFNSILYLSAITGIDPGLYEAARIDGAGRVKQIWYVTLPSIMPTIAIMLILAVGSLLSSNTDLILLLYSSSIYETSDVLGTYIYRVGIQGGKFSETAAIGLFATVVNFVLVFSANKISNKLTNTGMW